MNQTYEKVWLIEDNDIIIEKEVTPYPFVNVDPLRTLMHYCVWDLIFFISFIPDLLVAPGQYSYTHSTKSSHSTEFSHNSSSFK